MTSPVFTKVEIGNISVIALTRNGGVSESPFDSLNLGNYVGDNSDHVAANWKIVEQLADASGLAVLHAEHGTLVHSANEPGELPPGDGVITSKKNLGLVSLSADCVPFALVDPVNEVIAVGHAGWKGVYADLMSALSTAFVKAGGEITNSTAVLGPAICGKCYEVPHDRVDLFREVNPAAIKDDSHLSIKAGVEANLVELGYMIVDIAGCNFEDENLFSYRRNGITGRGGLVAIIN